MTTNIKGEEMKIPRYCISLTVEDNDTQKHVEEGCNVDTMFMVEAVIQKFIDDVKNKL